MQDPDLKCRHFGILWYFMAFYGILAFLPKCQIRNQIRFFRFFRFFSIFRLFPTFRLSDSTTLLRIKEVVMFVIEGRPNMNIAIITIIGLMAKNKRFCPGLKGEGKLCMLPEKRWEICREKRQDEKGSLVVRVKIWTNTCFRNPKNLCSAQTQKRLVAEKKIAANEGKAQICHHLETEISLSSETHLSRNIVEYCSFELVEPQKKW